jgi:hypothetical protein
MSLSESHDEVSAMIQTQRTQPVVRIRGTRDRRSRPATLQAAYVLSFAVVALMVAASLIGLFTSGLYQEGAWGREALRGGDLVTLVVAAPLLLLCLLLAMRGSVRAQAAWVGMLLYGIYDYAYYVFGATFNDLFLAHIALLSASVFTFACAIAGLDLPAIRDGLRTAVGVRAIAGFLVVVGVLQGGLWLFILIRNILTGEVMADVPVAGQHLVFALDLGFLTPSLILAGVLLWRDRPFGYLFGTAMAVMGAVYQVNMMMAAAFQARADVAGVKAFPPESLFLTATFVLAAGLLLFTRRRRSSD